MNDPVSAYDRRIVFNVIKATLRSPRDAVPLLIAIFLTFAGIKTWLAHRAWWIACWQISAASGFAGFAVASILYQRLTVHAEDGPLAAYALTPSVRRSYTAMWHLVFAGSLAVLVAAADVRLVGFAVAGYFFGTTPRSLLRSERPTISNIILKIKAFHKTQMSWSKSAISAFVTSAILATISMLARPSVDESTLLSIIGVGSTVATVWLTAIDEGSMRFSSLIGRPLFKAIGEHVKNPLLFCASETTVCSIMVNEKALWLIPAVTFCVVVVLMIRIMCYRVYNPRASNVFLFFATIICLVVCFSEIALLPAVLIIIATFLYTKDKAALWKVL